MILMPMVTWWICIVNAYSWWPGYQENIISPGNYWHKRCGYPVWTYWLWDLLGPVGFPELARELVLRALWLIFYLQRLFRTSISWMGLKDHWAKNHAAERLRPMVPVIAFKRVGIGRGWMIVLFQFYGSSFMTDEKWELWNALLERDESYVFYISEYDLEAIRKRVDPLVCFVTADRPISSNHFGCGITWGKSRKQRPKRCPPSAGTKHIHIPYWFGEESQ